LEHLSECHLDHIAIAVEDIEKSVALYSLLGLEFNPEREIVESQKVKTAFCPIADKANIELLEPTSEDSNIAKFLKNKGPGIHHLCFSVPDVKAKQVELEEKGLKFIYAEPFAGAHNCLVNFIHPKSMNGVLVEISQKQKG
jgi:methylmalonyl-CoA epimerase